MFDTMSHTTATGETMKATYAEPTSGSSADFENSEESNLRTAADKEDATHRTQLEEKTAVDDTREEVPDSSVLQRSRSMEQAYQIRRANSRAFWDEIKYFRDQTTELDGEDQYDNRSSQSPLSSYYRDSEHQDRPEAMDESEESRYTRRGSRRRSIGAAPPLSSPQLRSQAQGGDRGSSRGEHSQGAPSPSSGLASASPSHSFGSHVDGSDFDADSDDELADYDDEDDLNLNHENLLQRPYLQSIRQASSVVPAPTPLIPRHHLSTVHIKLLDLPEFHLFAFLPTEIRVRIWRYAALQPRIVHINYDVTNVTGIRHHSVDSNDEKSVEWRICNPMGSVSVRFACQESEVEADRVAFWNLFVLHRDITQRTWVNYKVDTIFLNSNALVHLEDHIIDVEIDDENMLSLRRPLSTEARSAGLRGQVRDADPTTADSKANQVNQRDRLNIEGRDHNQIDNRVVGLRPGGDDEPRVRAPSFLPIPEDQLELVQHLAVDMAFWRHWPFREVYGSDVTCTCCAGYGVDEGEEMFKHMIASLWGPLEELTLVGGGEALPVDQQDVLLLKGWGEGVDNEGAVRRLRQELEDFGYDYDWFDKVQIARVA